MSFKFPTILSHLKLWSLKRILGLKASEIEILNNKTLKITCIHLIKLINRPIVAGAVQQQALLVSHLLKAIFNFNFNI